MAYAGLAFIYLTLGQYDRMLTASKATLRLDPGGESYANVVSAYLYLNKLAEAHDRRRGAGQGEGLTDLAALPVPARVRRG